MRGLIEAKKNFLGVLTMFYLTTDTVRRHALKIIFCFSDSRSLSRLLYSQVMDFTTSSRYYISHIQVSMENWRRKTLIKAIHSCQLSQILVGSKMDILTGQMTWMIKCCHFFMSVTYIGYLRLNFQKFFFFFFFFLN